MGDLYYFVFFLFSIFGNEGVLLRVRNDKLF